MISQAVPKSSVVSPPLEDCSASTMGLAITGIDCLFPDAISIKPYWQNILHKQCSIHPIEDPYLGSLPHHTVEQRLAARMPSLALKPQQFRIPPSNARNFDPRVLPMLEVVRRVLDNQPGLNRESTLAILCCQKMMPKEEASTWVYRRLQTLSLLDQLSSLQHLDPQAWDRIKAEFAEAYDQRFPDPGFEGFLAESSSLMASIMSKTFNLGGGHIAMDATCASTIGALQMAWNTLEAGHHDSVLIVALSPEAVPSRFAHYAEMGIFTNAAVLPFDAQANGSALGEGIGVMLVKRLQDAEANGDRIHGTIRGMGFTSDGKGSGFVSPQRDGQIRAMQAAYRMSGIDPDQIGLVEAHATGTPKGDATELDSLTEVFSSIQRPVALGSVKGNIGHLLAASGMAGIFKVCCAMAEGILPPTLFRTPRPELQQHPSLFHLVDQPQPWPEGDPYRYAAVSSFGFGGVNAHLILEAHPSTAQGLQTPAHQRSVATSLSMPSIPLFEEKTSVPDMPSANGPHPTLNPMTQTVDASLPTVVAGGSPSAMAADVVMATPAEVEAGVLQIVSECTGYEIEELELDHDLDADLGIDSLKNMEILLKVGEKFRVQAQEGDQITDYPTIAKLVELAQTRQNTASAEEQANMMAQWLGDSESPIEIPGVTPAPANAAANAAADPPTPAMAGISTNGSTPPALQGAISQGAVAQTPAPLTPSPPSSAPTAVTEAEAITYSDAEVEAGVLQIVSECTGYEVEELELDHDLDADLGIDSLKNMEILLKVGEKFRVQAQEGDQITDYPTIAKLVELAQTRQNTASAEDQANMMAQWLGESEPPPEAAAALSAAMSSTTTTAPPEPIPSVATPTPGSLAPTNGAGSSLPTEATLVTVSEVEAQQITYTDAEVEAGVLQIVSECTGYEVEELELDHDLDADLGIDSLKNMEILLKVGEKFRVQAQEGDQITDYPTIAKLVELAQTRQNTASAEDQANMMAQWLGEGADVAPELAQQLDNRQIAAPTPAEPTPAPSYIPAAELPIPNGATLQPAVASAPAPAVSATQTETDAPTYSNAAVEAGVLQIVSECTGYEIDELELDHDLDADLGIDSLKNMEILLKVGEKFRVQAQEGDQITDYPTIAKLVELAQTRQNTASAEDQANMMAQWLGEGADVAPELAQQLEGRSIPASPTSTPTAAPPTAVIASDRQASVSTLAPELDRVRSVVSRLRNYEPEWLKPYLSLVADLGLAEEELTQVFRELGLHPNGSSDWTLETLATLLQGGSSPQTPSPAAPQATPASPISVPATPVAETPAQEWVLIYGYGSPDDANLVAQIQTQLSTVSLPILQLNTPSSAPQRPFALVVDRTSPTLAQDLPAKLAQSAGNSMPLQGIWWGETSPQAAALAWICPGSGSLYPGLLTDLEQLSPVIQEVLHAAQQAYQDLVGQELSFAGSTDPLKQRPATVTVSTAIGRLLQQCGVHPDLLAGHSVGELTACHLAGAFDLRELIRLTAAPFQHLSSYPQGEMVALLGPEQQSLSLVQSMAGRVVISNRNSPQQLVVSGEAEAIRQLMERATQIGLNPRKLEVQTAYHSPMLESAHLHYRQALAQTQFQLPAIPIVSGLTGDLLPWSTLSDAQTKAMLECAFIAPVNHVAQLQRLRSLGMGTLLDLGPTDRLAKLAKDTLDPQVITLGANRTKRSSRQTFLECLAMLHVRGHQIQPLPPHPTQPCGKPPLARTGPITITPIPAPVPQASTPSATIQAQPVTPAHSTVTNTPIQSEAAPPAVAPTSAVPATAQIPANPSFSSTPAVPQPVTSPQTGPDLRQQRPTLLEPVAVIGMGGMLPDAHSIKEFWDNLVSGHDAVRELPQDQDYRWQIDTFYDADPTAPEKTYSKIGAFVPHVKFKPMEFRVTPKTANHMDRTQKFALLATREAFQDSGYSERPFDRKRVRVIIGTSVPELQDLGAPRLFFDQIAGYIRDSEVFQALPDDIQTQIIEHARTLVRQRIPASSEDTMPGALPNIVAGRIAFCFDIQGGNVILDAACAASLAALDHAIKTLRLGEADMVIMGGSDSAMSPSSYVGFCKTYALSATHSSPFDAKADGFVMGEGAGILLLKRLSDAERDQDTIHAVIRGIGSSSDGRSRGITAPSAEGQILAMERAYQDAGIDPATIGFVEAHGTSTAVGDVTEFNSLSQMFGPIAKTKPIYLGSVKSMIGHLKTAAGVASLIKGILSAKHGLVPPTLNFTTPNPKIDLEAAPFIINTETQTWQHEGPTPRRVGVNSFGFGGTNYHVILEAYDPNFYRSSIFLQELQQTQYYQQFFAGLGMMPMAAAVAPTSGTSASGTSASVPSASGTSASGTSASVPAPTPTQSRPPTQPTAVAPSLDPDTALRQLEVPLALVSTGSEIQILPAAQGIPAGLTLETLKGWIPAVTARDLGAASFRADHGVKFNYIAGAMAGGIGSVDIVVDMAKAGMLGFFGSGGLPPKQVEESILQTKQRLSDHPNAAFGFNLLHNPIEPGVEDNTVDLYLNHQVRKVSASAYLRLTPSVVRYRAKGMRRLPDGRIEAPNQVFAKISSPDIAAQFMAPPPAMMLKQLVNQGQLTPEEAELAAQLPVAQDITAEADSGGHTDRRPLSVLLPQILRLRDQMVTRHDYQQKGIALRVGAAGSIGDPLSVRAAFALGADYVLTGSINQSSLQAGTSARVKQMLSQATMTDITMAPAADMFEMGVQVQILKRGTFFPQRARKLFEVYRAYDGLEFISGEDRTKLERDIFKATLEEAWENTANYWRTRDPERLAQAERDPKLKMSLTFRAYMGLSSRWAKAGEESRKSDYQIWCGPSMGLFNTWVAGSWLEPLENRDVVLMGLSLLQGAAILTRAEQAAGLGVSIPSWSDLSQPVAREQLLTYLS